MRQPLRSIAVLLFSLTVGLIGCQEITPPVIRQLPRTNLSQAEAREFALQRIRLGDLHLQAGYPDLAYENYWVAYRKDNSDFTPQSLSDVDLLVQSLRIVRTRDITAPALDHGTIARIALALEMQEKYRLLASNFEFFASEDQAGSLENAVTYNIAAGYYYYRGGLYRYALPPLKKAVSIDPQSLEAYSNLAQVSEQLGDTEAALSYWRMIRVISDRLDSGDPHQGAIRAYYQQLSQTRIDRLEEGG